METGGNGRFSEWNEGVFKSKRLHDIQQSINLMRSNPLGMTEGKYNFEWLIHFIGILFSEGLSKYNVKEKVLVKKFRDLCEEALQVTPPIVVVKSQGFSNQKRGTVQVNKTNLKILLQLCDSYDEIVKDFNDKHGLTTRNEEEGGLFD